MLPYAAIAILVYSPGDRSGHGGHITLPGDHLGGTKLFRICQQLLADPGKSLQEGFKV